MRQGFTLIELSIVLVIIGLLIGGILVGRSMIETTKILSIVKNLQQYEVAISNFGLNYKSAPGDSKLFIPAGTGDGAVAAGPAGAMASCNGTYSNIEGDQAWSHLSQAGMIKTNYIPYQPDLCGGPQDSDRNMMGGITFAYTDLDTKSATTYYNENQLKHPINIGMLANENMQLGFIVPANQTLPLEAKLGSTTDPLNIALGLRNLAAPGMCTNGDTDIVDCAADNAKIGMLGYMIRRPGE